MVKILAYPLGANKNLKLINFDAPGKFKGFKLVAHNVRSLSPKIHKCIWETQNSNADVFCLSETWLRPEIEDTLINIPGYNSFRLDRMTGNRNGPKPGGGLCTYVKEGILVKPLVEHNLSNANIEMQVIELCYNTCRNMIIINLYRPPTGDQNIAVDVLRNTFFELTDLHDRIDIIITGDININMLVESPNRKLILDFCDEAILSCDILIPTRETTTTCKLSPRIFEGP